MKLIKPRTRVGLYNSPTFYIQLKNYAFVTKLNFGRTIDITQVISAYSFKKILNKNFNKETIPSKLENFNL